jgi:two-component system, sensor histidine kinase
VTQSLVNPADSPEVQNRKLLLIAGALMRRVEQSTDDSGAAYAQFQRAVLLEDQVRSRTSELENALDLLNGSNALLAEATREAEAARQNLANAIETVQDGFALFDPADRMVMCNSRFCQQFGDVHPRLFPGLGFVEYVDLISHSSDLALKPGETPETWAQARIRRHSDRDVVLNVALTQDRWLQVSERRTRDDGTVILQTDLTDIIRIERQERGKLLDDQARIVRATLDHISQGVGLFDSESRLVGWNARLAELLSFPVARLRLGLPFDVLLGWIMGQLRFGGAMTLDHLVRWVVAAGARGPLSFEVTRDDGFTLAIFAQEMPDGGFVMSFSDITAERAALRAISEANETLEMRVKDRTVELAEALDRAEAARAARSRFVAAASHDLLQPLSAAKLFLASIADEDLTAGAKGTLEKTQNALKSVEDILGALLDISRLEAGPEAIDVGAVRLDTILSQLRDEFGPMAGRKGLQLDILPCSAVVESDATYLRRILQNLIGNAVRYTTSGRVLVGARRLPGAVRVEILDTGPGIPEKEQDSIFREFHRLDARASASEGMGLGLAIVERACILLGHPLRLHSVLGRGTRFTVTIPLSYRITEVPAARHLNRWEAHGPQDQIVLIAEHDAELRHAIVQLLEKWGFNVIDVTTADEALTLMAELGIVPDKFLVEHHLGEGDGVALVTALRSRFGEIAVRLISSDRAARIAEIDVMQKPLDSEALARFLFACRP